MFYILISNQADLPLDKQYENIKFSIKFVVTLWPE